MESNFAIVCFNKYKNVLNNLFQNVPENYQKKEDIKIAINYVLGTIKYAGPEIILQRFAGSSVRIKENLAEEDNDWATNSWNEVLETHKEMKSLYNKYND